MVDPATTLGSSGGAIRQKLQSPAVMARSSSPEVRPVDARSKPLEDRRAGASKEILDEAAKRVQDFLKDSASELKFLVDKDTGRVVFKIINPETRETIRQVPSEEVLAMAKRMEAKSGVHDSVGVLMDSMG